MKIYAFSIALLLLPLLAFCQQMTRVCNEWDVQNQVVSLRQWGCRIYSVRCENPYADIRDRRWIIVYEQ